MNDAIRKAWVDVYVPEMKAFISVLIIMGLCRRFSYRSYWSTNWLLDMPCFRSILPCDRFFAILRFLHLSDNSSAIPRGQPGLFTQNPSDDSFTGCGVTRCLRSREVG